MAASNWVMYPITGACASVTILKMRCALSAARTWRTATWRAQPVRPDAVRRSSILVSAACWERAGRSSRMRPVRSSKTGCTPSRSAAQPARRGTLPLALRRSMLSTVPTRRTCAPYRAAEAAEPVLAADRPDQRGIPFDERVPCLLVAGSCTSHQIRHEWTIARRVGGRPPGEHYGGVFVHFAVSVSRCTAEFMPSRGRCRRARLAALSCRSCRRWSAGSRRRRRPCRVAATWRRLAGERGSRRAGIRCRRR